MTKRKKKKPLIENTDYSIYKPEYSTELPVEEDIDILNTKEPVISQPEFSTFGKLNQPFGGYDKSYNTNLFKTKPEFFTFGTLDQPFGGYNKSYNTNLFKTKPVFLNTKVKKSAEELDSPKPDLYLEALDNDLKNLKEYQIANGIITGVNMASNIPGLMKKSLMEPISAPTLQSPKLQSNVTAEMNQMDSAMGQYYANLRNMEEIGIDDPNVILAGSADALNKELEQRGKIMQEENNRINEQSKIDAEIANKQSEINMNVELQNKQMQYEDNAKRSAEKENARQNIISAASQFEATRLQANDKKQQEKILFETLKGMTQQQRSNYFMSQLYNTTGQETVKDNNYKQNDDYNDYLTWKQQNNK